MAVNVSTELLKSGGNEVLNSFTSCEGPYQAVASASCDVPAFNSFKGKLQSEFSTFEKHSNIFSSKIHDCAICLEEIDSLIASGASGKQLVSVNNIGFGALGGITVAANVAAEFLDSKSDNLDESDADSVATDTDVDTDIAYYGANLQPKNNSDISHRGYTHGDGTYYYENSVGAFTLAGEKGFWGCETDVRLDNGVLVCKHNKDDGGRTPPAFEEYLDVCKEYGMTAIIDLKYNTTSEPELAEGIIKTIEEKGMLDNCILQTNNHTDIPHIREISEDARIWYLVDSPDVIDKYITPYNVEGVNICAYAADFGTTTQRIKTFVSNGIDVCVWGVTTESSKQKYLDAGASHVMSDYVLGITPYQEGEFDYNGIEN